MNVESKIMMVFISQCIEAFTKHLNKRALYFNGYLADILLIEARVLSTILGSKFTDVVSTNNLENIVDAYNPDRDCEVFLSIEEAIPMCDSEIISVLDEACSLNSEQTDEITMLVCGIKDEHKIHEIIDLIELLESNYHLLKICLHDVVNQNRPISIESFTIMCAEFTLLNETSFHAWLTNLNAINIETKKTMVLDWCRLLLEDNLILEETFSQKRPTTIH